MQSVNEKTQIQTSDVLWNNDLGIESTNAGIKKKRLVFKVVTQNNEKLSPSKIIKITPKDDPTATIEGTHEDNKTKTYLCSLCEKTFDRTTYYKHVKNKKTACISSEKCVKIVEENKCNNNKLKKYEKTLKKKDEEISKLSQQLEIVTKAIQPKMTIHGDYINGDYINQIYNNNSKQMVSFKFSTPENERIDHIPDDRMLAIVNISDFDEVLTQLVDAVYFDPLAPQNFRWCVSDLDALYGALEYDSESKRIATRKTSSVINNNVRNILDRVVEVVEDLQKKHNFSDVQNRNTAKLFGLIGVDLESGQMKGIKQKAYAERDHIRSVWKKYDIRPIQVKE